MIGKVHGGTFPILVWISPILVLLSTSVWVPLGTPFVSTVRFLGTKGSH